MYKLSVSNGSGTDQARSLRAVTKGMRLAAAAIHVMAR